MKPPRRRRIGGCTAAPGQTLPVTGDIVKTRAVRELDSSVNDDRRVGKLRAPTPIESIDRGSRSTDVGMANPKETIWLGRKGSDSHTACSFA